MRRCHTILCVDDDMDDRYILSETINRLEPAMQVVEVENGVEALNYLHRAKESGELPCLVILDINMPYLDGKKTMEKIKADHNLDQMPVVILTSSENPQDRALFESLGIEMVTKPDNYHYFQKVVQDFLLYCR